MPEERICNQQGCDDPGAFRFTWPGKDEAVICKKHTPRLKAIAQALGLHLQLIALESAND